MNVLTDVLPWIILFTLITVVLIICGVFFFIVSLCFGHRHEEYPVTILPTTVMVTTETAGHEELDANPYTFRYGACGGPAGDQQVEECVVCLERFELQQMMRRLPECGHYFHAECIDAWLQQNPTCPICRRLLDWECWRRLRRRCRLA